MNKREEKEEYEEMLREYDFGKGERGKYAGRFEQGSNIGLWVAGPKHAGLLLQIDPNRERGATTQR